MTIRELIQTVDEVRDVLVEKFIDTFDRKPKKEELLEYVKKIYKEQSESDILEQFFLEDFEFPEDFGKLLLVFSATIE
jgi:hypothetical protein